MKKRGGGKTKRKKITQREERKGFTPFLPDDIIANIISRLPLNEILVSCSCVCKSWNNLFKTPSFCQEQILHSQNQSAAGDDVKVSFLFMIECELSPLFYGDIYFSKDSDSRMELKIVNHQHITKRCGVDAFVGSCNGLVCISVPDEYEMNDPIYICNPFTEENTFLPMFFKMDGYKNNVEYKKTNFPDGCIVSGFGYLPNTNEYKVVRIFYEENPRKSDQPKGLVQVYTLGSGSGWRAKGEITYSLQHFGLGTQHLHCVLTFGSALPTRSVLANGVLHWLDNEGRIVAFDLADEEFRLLPSPPCLVFSGKTIYQLQVLNGCLCLLHETKGVSLDMWSFKESGEWERMFSISHWKQSGLLLRTPHHKGKLMDEWWPVSLTSTGKVLLRYNHDTLISYDPQDVELKQQVDLSSHMLGPRETLIHAIPHTPSLVSLKSLGEESQERRRLEDDENPSSCED